MEFAEKSGITVIGNYIDRALSAKTDNRPEFQKMIKDSYRKVFDSVIVWKVDRFARNRYDSAYYKNILKKNGVKVISAKEHIGEGSEGIILEAMLEGYAEYYSAELSQKVKRGMNETRQKGNFTGGTIIYGYKVENHKVVIAEEKAEVVRFIYDQYAQGVYVKDIIKTLTERGIFNRGKKFARNTVYNILKNEKYSGIYRHGNKVFTNMYPQIVPTEIYENVRRKTETNKYGTRSVEVVYLLRNKLICGDCKHRMIGISGTSKTGAIHYYYSCKSKQRRKMKCNTKPIQKQFLEDMVIHTTSEMLKSVSAIHKIAENIYNVHKAETADNTALKLLERKQKEALKAQNNIIKAIEQGIITEATKIRLTELEKQLTSLEFEIAKEKARSYTYLTVEQIEMYLSKFVFENTDDIKVRKLIVNAFVWEVILYEDEIVITYTFTDNPGHLKRTKDTTLKTENQIEQAEKSASSYIVSSSIFSHFPPRKDYPNTAVSKSGIRIVFTLPKEGTL